MATLTLAEKNLILDLVRLMQDQYEKPLDGTVAERLAKFHTKFGYTSEIAYLEALRDRPFTALLKSLLAVAA